MRFLYVEEEEEEEAALQDDDKTPKFLFEEFLYIVSLFDIDCFSRASDFLMYYFVKRIGYGELS